MSKSIGLLYIKVSIVFLLIGCIWGAIQTFPEVHEFIEAGPGGIIVGMHTHWNLLGWVGLAIMGGIYYLVPQMTGNKLYSERLALIQLYLYVLFVVIVAILGVTAGIKGGNLFLAGRVSEIEMAIGPYMMGISILSVLEAFIPNFIFAYNIYKTL